MLIIGGVNVFPTQIEEVILKLPSLSPQYQLVVSREGHLDKLQVRSEMREEAAVDVSAIDRLGMAEALRQSIKTYVGISAEIEILDPNSIERTLVGKAKRVVDRRPKASGSNQPTKV